MLTTDDSGRVRSCSTAYVFKGSVVLSASREAVRIVIKRSRWSVILLSPSGYGLDFHNIVCHVMMMATYALKCLTGTEYEKSRLQIQFSGTSLLKNIQ